MSLSQVDRKKLLIGAGVVVLAVIVLFFVLKSTKRRARQGRRAGGFGAEGETAATTPAPAPGVTPTAPGTEAVAPEGAIPAPAGPLMLGPIVIGRGSEVRTRADPFETFELPPQPPPPELVVNAPAVTLRPGGIRVLGVAQIEEVSGEIGRYRVSGLMFDEGAYAILEAGPGQAFVVKPGDIVQGNRIAAIGRDCIYLVDSEGKRWQVQLRGSGPGGAALSETSSTVAGMPENPPGEF